MRTWWLVGKAKKSAAFWTRSKDWVHSYHLMANLLKIMVKAKLCLPLGPIDGGLSHGAYLYTQVIF